MALPGHTVWCMCRTHPIPMVSVCSYTAGLKLKPIKCHFLGREVTFLKMLCHLKE